MHAPNQLFANGGNGTFTDVATSAGVRTVEWTKGEVWGDYDSDGSPDLYVSNTRGATRLFHNNRDGTFTDAAGVLGVATPHDSFAARFWDVDNDGRLDLLSPDSQRRLQTWQPPRLAARRALRRSSCIGEPESGSSLTRPARSRSTSRMRR